MSILTSASSSSVSRGYDYYKNHKVSGVNQLNDHEFEGYVEGSRKSPYYVKINIEHPRKSYCDCPHANGNITCKHMTALYFELFPDEVDDYESWLNSDYDEDEGDEYYDDYFDDTDFYHYREESSFEEPLFFDIVLKNYVDSLNANQLKKVLYEELNNDKKRTYKLYLEKNYNKYLNENSEDLIFLDKLNKKVQDMTGYYSYDYNDFDKEILNVREKQKIERIYQNKSLRGQIDKILFNEKLAVYSDFKWIAGFYKKTKDKEEIIAFCNTLENYLDSLKHYSIKNTVPKSNILIVIYILSDFNNEELAISLIKNAKYLQYVDYIIYNNSNVIDLYNNFINEIDENYLKNKMYIPDILYRFVDITDHENNEINTTHYLYSFLCLGDDFYLDILTNYLKEKEIIKIIESKTKDTTLLVKLYRFFNKDENLWNLLINSKYRYFLLSNIDILKNKYNNKLYEHFKKEFYNILKEDKNREVYHKASKYIIAIRELNNGANLVNDIINDLKKSEYQKCSALFDEIREALK